MPTLKFEEVYLQSYRDGDDAPLHVQEWKGTVTASVYTQTLATKLHQRAKRLPANTPWRKAWVLRRRNIYSSDEWKAAGPAARPLGDHRSDESATGCAFLGCSPEEPMSASTVLHSSSLNPAAVWSAAKHKKVLNFLSQFRLHFSLAS